MHLNAVSVEDQTTLDQIPAPAREAIAKAGGNHKLLVETVSEKGSTFYEAHFKTGLRTQEIKVDVMGKTGHELATDVFSEVAEL